MPLRDSMGARGGGLGTGWAVPLTALLLVGIRFAAPSATAALGVQGIDTSGLNAAFRAYNLAVPALAAVLAAILLWTWPHALRLDRWILLALAGIVATLVFWAGEADPAYRLVWGAWATIPLALSVTATILAYGFAMGHRLRGAGALSTLGLRALTGGFAAAYLVGALRFIDYHAALGEALPSGGLWLMDYAPTFVPCAISVSFWLMMAARPAPGAAGVFKSWALPLAGAAVGVGVAQGLGGFILSNALAWGGAYEVFVPTALSLAVVGFAVGSFLATAWVLRGRVPDPRWRLIVCGVSATALAGLLFFDGALASLAGILLGLTLAGRGVRRPRGLADIDPTAAPVGAAEYRE